MMSCRARRLFRKLMAVGVLLLDLTGARMVSVVEACEPAHAYCSSALSFKAILKLAAGQPWQRRAARSFGARVSRSAFDLELLTSDDRPALAPTEASIVIAHCPDLPGDGLRHAARHPRDRSPTNPPQLN